MSFPGLDITGRGWIFVPVRATYLAIVLFSLAPLAAANAPIAPTGFPHERSDLKPYPGVVWGRLENGLRYAVLPNAFPARHASLCLAVEAGSYVEDDDERGYAHFVEHMAFRGTREFPGESAMRVLEQYGVGFGPHVNATTRFFETDYRLTDVPSDNPQALATAIRMLRGIADGVTFAAADVEAERGVIFSEQRVRGGELATASWQHGLEFLPPESERSFGYEISTVFGAGHRLSRRMPIGTEKTLRAASDRKLRAFYEKWYRPERMVVTIVGDLSAPEAERLVRETFATMTARREAPVEPDLPAPTSRFQNHRPVGISEFPNEPQFRVTLETVGSPPAADNAASRREALRARMARAMLDARLDRLAEGADAPIVSGGVTTSGMVRGRELLQIRVTARPANWLRAIAALEYEVRRAGEDGFTATELERARERVLSNARAAAAAQRHPWSAQLSHVLAYAVLRGIVFTDPEDDVRFIDREIGTVTLEECHAVIRDLLPSTGGAYAVAGTFGGAVPGPEKVSDALVASMKRPIEPYAAPAPPAPFPYDDFGPVGTVVADEAIAAVDAHRLVLSNGVRLNFKRTEFEPGRVSIAVHFGAGRLANPPDKPGLDLRALGWIACGVNRLTLDEQHAALAPLAQFDFSGEATEFVFSSTEQSEHLPLLLRALAAYFVDPAFRPERWTQSLEFVRQQCAPFESTAPGVATNVLWRQIFGGRPVTTVPPFESVARRTLDEFKAWFLPHLASDPIELTIVGDVDPAEMQQAVLRTFGALPKRSPDQSADRALAPMTQSFSRVYYCDGVGNLAAVRLNWRAFDLTSAADRTRLTVLAAILQERLWRRLRVQLGQAYNPRMDILYNDGIRPPFTFAGCSIDCAPAVARQVATVASEVAHGLAAEGVTSDELTRAVKPMQEENEASSRRNNWWIGLLVSHGMETPNIVARYAAHDGLKDLTTAEVDALAKRVLVSERESRLVVLPLHASPASPEAGKADALAAKGDFRRAIAGYDRAIKQDPEFQPAFNNRGCAKLKTKDYAGAFADFDRAVALVSDDPVAYANRGTARRNRKDLNGAVADLTRALELNPDYAYAYVERGVTRVRLNDLPGALADYDHAIQLEPGNRETFLLRAEVRKNLGDAAGAAADEARGAAPVAARPTM